MWLSVTHMLSGSLYLDMGTERRVLEPGCQVAGHPLAVGPKCHPSPQEGCGFACPRKQPQVRAVLGGIYLLCGRKNIALETGDAGWGLAALP